MSLLWRVGREADEPSVTSGPAKALGPYHTMTAELTCVPLELYSATASWGCPR